MIGIAQPQINHQEIEMVADVLQSGNLACGDMVKQFERTFADTVGTKYAVAVSSGTAALHLALKVVGVRRGDEVITPALSFIATPNSILYNQGVPVFADVDPQTYNLDISKVEELITPQTKAVLPVHLYGNPVQMHWLQEIADDHNLRVVGDACQAHGARHNHTLVGGFGDLECFSFYPTKNMTCGEGGMITTNNQSYYELLMGLRNHGRDSNGEFMQLGFNYRMTDIHAAIGLMQIKKLTAMNWQRIKNAMFLSSQLNGLDGVTTPQVGLEDVHVYHQYTIQHHHRNGLVVALNNNQIGFGIYYPQVLYQYPHLQIYRRRCPRAEQLTKQVVSLPVHPGLTQNQLQHISAVVKEAS